ncbi:MAG: NCS2 family permease [Kiritimatiellia bacterium]|jgi:AGZA family xanthine/uracil permease-like MFS transporter
MFKLSQAKTTVKTEVVAGITTFMAMAYILAVNPDILSACGMPKGGVFVATALASFVGTMLMALLANYPFALAPGMGLNAFFAFAVCGAMGYSWQFALLAILVEGLLFLALSLTPVREGLFNSIPLSMKKAVAVGIGLFITFIALQNAKVVVDNPATLVDLAKFNGANFHSTGMWAILAIAGTLVAAILVARGVPGAILLGIFITWILGMACERIGLYRPDPAAGCFSTIPHFGNYFTTLGDTFREFGTTCGAVFHSDQWTRTVDGAVVGSGWSLVKSLDFFAVMFAFFFVDLFDTLGTLIGCAMKGDMLDKDGKLPRISGALCADSIATCVGAVFGTSTVTTYVESASGVAAGGRTGLTAVTTAAFFILALVFSPIFLAIPGFATATALMLVGFYMIQAITGIDFEDPCEGIPAFICIASMPLTYSISNGIMFGVISYAVINLFAGRAKKVHPIMYVLAVVFIAKYALI